MTLDVVVDTWEVLKHHISGVDLNDAAYDLVSLLVDVHGYDPQDIYESFTDHPAVRKAAKLFTTVDEVDDDYERYYDDHYDDED